ncbi:MAG TPA: WG repeat-containing protein [Flavisolibacter sp.]|nr:WG repeat-containing protein [Flavisolibacter sp.]
MKQILTTFLLITCLAAPCQETKYIYSVSDTSQTSAYSYYLVNAKGDTLKKLPKDKYFIIMNDRAEKFFVAGIKGYKSWQAIDKDENILFQVYNISYGEPTPDYLRNGYIRIVDSTGKIGFADRMGNIVIQPQFAFATSFDSKHAIIAMDCKFIFNEHEHEGDCVHPSLECRQWGFIDRKGKLKMPGNFTFDEISRKINWKPEEE